MFEIGVTVCELGESLLCAGAALSATRERCIQAQYLCDGYNDCYNGDYSDEFGCGLLYNITVL